MGSYTYQLLSNNSTQTTPTFSRLPDSSMSEAAPFFEVRDLSVQGPVRRHSIGTFFDPYNVLGGRNMHGDVLVGDDPRPVTPWSGNGFAFNSADVLALELYNRVREVDATRAHRLQHSLNGNISPIVAKFIRTGLAHPIPPVRLPSPLASARRPVYIGGGATIWVDDTPGRQEWISKAWNAFMHALNGNRRPAKKESRKAKEPKAVAKAVKEVKKEVKKVVRMEKKPTKKGTRKGHRTLSVQATVHGRGDYEFGTNIGSKIGGFLGGKLHEWIKRITGFGDYEIHGEPVQNSLLARDSVPTFASKKSGGTILQFEEYLGYIPVTQGFSITSFPLDPTSRRSFPWSWQISKRFQQYIIRGMVVVVKSNMSPLTTSGVIGTIFGSARYNVDARAPTSKPEVMNSQFCESESANNNLIFAIECAPSQTIWPLKIRQNGTTTGEEQLYQLGMLDICSQGAQADYPNGAEVYVIYDLELLKPRIGTGGPVDMFMADLTGANNTLPLAMVPSTPLVPQPRINSLGLDISDTGVITFPYDAPAGAVYKITCAYYNASPIGGFIGLGSNVHTVAKNFYVNQSNSQITTSLASGGPWIAYSTILVGVIQILSGATLGSPPSVKVGTNANLPNIGGILMVEETDARVCSGLTSLPPNYVTRGKFLEGLRGLKSAGVYTGIPLDLKRLRLVDYVEALRENYQIDINDLERCQEAHEITLEHAIERLSIYESTAALSGCMDEEKEVTACGWSTLSINGANGEYTGTDDVKRSDGTELTQREVDEVASEVIPVLREGCVRRHIATAPEQAVVVNPMGGFGPAELIVAATRARDSKGWSDPAAAVIPLGSNMFLWPSAPNLMSRKLIRQYPRGVWTIDKLRRVQCRAMCGTACLHSVDVCPGYASLLKDMLFANDGGDDDTSEDEGHDACTTLNGSNGEATNTDDLAAKDEKDPWSECHSGSKCQYPSHYHREKGKGVAKTEAARRHHEKQVKEGLIKRPQKKYVLCTLATGLCLIPGPHYHHLPDDSSPPPEPEWTFDDDAVRAIWPDLHESKEEKSVPQPPPLPKSALHQPRPPPPRPSPPVTPKPVSTPKPPTYAKNGKLPVEIFNALSGVDESKVAVRLARAILDNNKPTITATAFPLPPRPNNAQGVPPKGEKKVEDMEAMRVRVEGKQSLPTPQTTVGDIKNTRGVPPKGEMKTPPPFTILKQPSTPVQVAIRPPANPNLLRASVAPDIVEEGTSADDEHVNECKYEKEEKGGAGPRLYLQQDQRGSDWEEDWTSSADSASSASDTDDNRSLSDDAVSDASGVEDEGDVSDPGDLPFYGPDNLEYPDPIRDNPFDSEVEDDDPIDLWPWIFHHDPPERRVGEPLVRPGLEPERLVDLQVPRRPPPPAPPVRRPDELDDDDEGFEYPYFDMAQLPLPPPGVRGEEVPRAPQHRPLIGDAPHAEPIKEVLLYYTSDVVKNLSAGKRIGKYLLGKLPFVKHSTETITNEATPRDVEEVMEVASSTRDAFTLVPFWSQSNRRKPFKKFTSDEVTVELMTLGYRSCAKAFIFTHFLDYLRGWGEETRDLQVRRPATSVEGNLELIPSFRDAVLRVVQNYPRVEELHRASVVTFYNTVTYYIQQRLVVESRLSLGEAQKTGFNFRVTARPLAHPQGLNRIE